MYKSTQTNGEKTVGLHSTMIVVFLLFSFNYLKNVTKYNILQRLYIERRINIDLCALVSYLRLCLPWKLCELLKLPLGESIDPLMEALADSGTESKGYDSTKHAVLIRVLSSSV